MFPTPTPSEEAIQQLKEQLPGKRLRLLEACGATLIVRAPSEPEIVRMNTAAADRERRLTAANRLLRDVCVWPAPAALDDILRELPALPYSVSDQILELSGMTADVQKKDL